MVTTAALFPRTATFAGEPTRGRRLCQTRDGETEYHLRPVPSARSPRGTTVHDPWCRNLANRVSSRVEGGGGGGSPAPPASSRDPSAPTETPPGIFRGPCCPPAPSSATCTGTPRNRRPSRRRAPARSSEPQPPRNGSTDRGGREQARPSRLGRSFLQLLHEGPQFLSPPVGLVGPVQFHAEVATAVRGDRRGGVDHHLGGHAGRIGRGVEQVFRQVRQDEHVALRA